MKKIMMFVVAAICAVAAQAASVDWGSGTIKIDGATAGKGAVNGYLYLVSESVYSGLDFSDGKAVYDEYKAKTASATGTSTKTGVVKMTTTAGIGETQYAVIIYETSDASQFILSKGYDTVNDLGVQSNIASGGLAVSANATGWTPTEGTPEPSSGLLLLLGGAMLALRRKQK